MNTSPTPGRAKPFRIESSLRRLPLQHPRPEEVALLADCKGAWGHEAFVRLWLTEGAPYAFRDCPDVYEDIRGWLGSRLDVCPKDITVTGSARFGFSLSPPPKYGKPFGSGSDFDFALVSSSAFDGFRAAFIQWEQDYRRGVVSPRNERESSYWEANVEFLHQNLPQGFLDAKKLPTRDRYPISQLFNNAMWVLIEKLRVTPGAPVPLRASVRVYKDWKQLVRRVTFNLRSVVRQLAA